MKYTIMRQKTIFIILLFCGIAVHAGENMRCSMSARAGIWLVYGEEIISSGSRLTAATPDWSRKLYKFIESGAQIKSTPAEAVATGGGNRCVELKTYRVNINGNTAELELRLRNSGDQDILVEHIFMTTPGELLAGGEWSAVRSRNRCITGTIPFFPDKNNRAAIIPASRRIEVSAPSGKLTVEAVRGAWPRLDDRRTKPHHGDYPQLIWYTSSTLAPGRETRSLIRISFTPAPSSTEKPEDFSPRDADTPTVRTFAAPEPPPLIPTPQKMTPVPGGEYRIEPGDRIIVSGDRSGRLFRHAQKVAAQWGITAEHGDEMPRRGIFVRAGVPELENEEYTLRTSTAGVALESGSERGAFYALQTLKLLCRNGVVPGTFIHDRPDFRIRGIHTIGNSGTVTLFPALFERVFAPLKLNTLLLEVQHTKWEATPELHNPRGINLADIPVILSAAYENYIDVIPILATFSHCQWLFFGGANQDMAEDIHDPFNYNVSHPGVYPLMEKVLDEAMRRFPSPYFNIGHDELRIGVHHYPVRPEHVKRGAPDILKSDILWYHDLLRRHGRRMMMWHDTLLAPHEVTRHPGTVALAFDGTEKLRRTLPRDIIIGIWNYKPDKPDHPNSKEFPEVDIFLRDGYEVIGCTWHRPGNTENFAAYCAGKPGVLGMIQTTWSHFGTETMLYTHFKQAASWVRAGAAFWNARAAAAKNPDPEEIFLALFDPPRRGSEMLTPVPMPANTVLKHPGFAFERIPGDTIVADGVPFMLNRPEGRVAGLVGASRLNPAFPSRLSIPIGAKCDTLYILGVLLRKPRQCVVRLGRMRVVYDDGSVETEILRGNLQLPGAQAAPPLKEENGADARNILEFFTPDALTGYRNRRAAAFEWSPDGEHVFRLWPLTWKNPCPDKKISRLEFSDLNSTYPIALLALTLGEQLN